MYNINIKIVDMYICIIVLNKKLPKSTLFLISSCAHSGGHLPLKIKELLKTIRQDNKVPFRNLEVEVSEKG